jgi:hypothetical protein
MSAGLGWAQRKQVVTGLTNCGAEANCPESPLLADKSGKRLNIRSRAKAQPSASHSVRSAPTATRRAADGSVTLTCCEDGRHSSVHSAGFGGLKRASSNNTLMRIKLGSAN